MKDEFSLDNFEKAIKIIEDEYFKEANEILNSWVGPESGHYIISHDSAPTDSRFGTEEARVNDRMTDSYKDFVWRVGKILLHFCSTTMIVSL